MCVVLQFTLDVGVVDAPAGVPQEGGHTGFLQLLSAVLALFSRRIQTSLSLVDREVDFCVPDGKIVFHLLGMIFFFFFFFCEEKFLPNGKGLLLFKTRG